jgi:hypothetical protein
VDELVDTSAWRYAIISVRSEPDRERLVIAYPDEGTLRELIAAPSIAALGYTSRADALRNIDRCVTTKASVKRLLKMASLHPKHDLFDRMSCCIAATRRHLGLSETSKSMRNLLHNSLTGALVFFYSKNVLSSTVRAFVSF